MILKKSAVVFLFLIRLLVVNSQAPKFSGKFTPFIDDNINGFWEYIPRNYSVDLGKRYPLLIFIHGSGEQGSVQDMTTLNLVLRNGPPKIISAGTFPDSFQVNGSWNKFLVICPQIKNGLFGASSSIAPSTVQNVIQYAKGAYRIDTTKIYLTGLSMGGGATWDYAGSSLQAANTLAAIVVACGAGDVSVEEAASIAGGNVPILATHNWDDPLVAASRTTASINNILAYSPPIQRQPRAIFWTTGGHNAWRRTFENINAGSTVGGNVTDTLGINVYQWMLQFSRLRLALPVSWKSFSVQKKDQAVLIEWILATQESVKEFSIEKSKDAREWKSISIIKAKPENQNVHYEYLDLHPAAGKNFYRVIAIDVNGSVSYSSIRDINSDQPISGIAIYPNPFAERLLLDVPSIDDPQLTIRITDGNGKLISNKQVVANNHTTIIDGVQHLPAGSYYVSIVSRGKQLYRQQLIKE